MYRVKVRTEDQDEALMRSNHVGKLTGKVDIRKYGYAPKSIIFVYEYAVTDLENEKKMSKRLPVSDATYGLHVGSLGSHKTVKNKEIPNLIKTAGEQALAKVYN